MDRGTAKAILTLALTGVLAVAVKAQVSPGYYAPAEGKSGAELRAALHGIVRGHRVVPYSSSSKADTADALKVLDRDPASTNNVLLIYAPGVSMAASSFGTTAGWNREHLWCDSYGLDGVEPAYSDLHNLRAIDATVNSARGNKFFDVSATNSAGYKFPAHAEAPMCSTDTDSWEPPDAQKGDIARALFYMTIRYTGDATNEPHLRLTDATNLVTATTNLMGRFTTLLKWHLADPVDAPESNRNNAVCWLYQTNRNPFVDHPEWVAAAFIPPLRAALAGTNVVLAWTNDYTPTLRVEATTSGSGGSWVVITNAPVLDGGNWTLVEPVAGVERFYRLRLE